MTQFYAPAQYKDDFSDELGDLSLIHKLYLKNNFYGVVGAIDNTQLVGIVDGIENVDGTTYNVFHQFTDYLDLIVTVVKDSDGRDAIPADIQRLSDRVIVTFAVPVQASGEDYRVLVTPIKTPTALEPSVQTPTKITFTLDPLGGSSAGVTEITAGKVYDISHTISSDVVIHTKNELGEKVICSEREVNATTVRIQFYGEITTAHKVTLI